MPNKTYPILNAKCEQEVNEIAGKAGEMSGPLKWIYVFKSWLMCLLTSHQPQKKIF